MTPLFFVVVVAVIRVAGPFILSLRTSLKCFHQEPGWCYRVARLETNHLTAARGRRGGAGALWWATLKPPVALSLPHVASLGVLGVQELAALKWSGRRGLGDRRGIK